MQSNMFSSSKLAFVAVFALQFSSISLAHPVIEERSAPIVMGLAKNFGAIAHTTLTSTGGTVYVLCVLESIFLQYKLLTLLP